VVCWDPRRIKGLRSRRHRWSISTNNGNLLCRINLLCALCRCLGPLSAFATALCLWEEGFDPSAVDEVAGSGEDGEQEDVKEDAITLLEMRLVHDLGKESYICGSNNEMGASTTVTVPLKAVT